MGDDFINSEEYLLVPPAKARHEAFYCASLVGKYLRGSRPIPRIDQECSEAIAARWIAEAGVPALYAASAYFSMKATQVQKGTGYSASWRSIFMKAIMNHLSQQECLMKWTDFCGKGRRLRQTLAVVASENSTKEKAAPILKHFIDPEIVKVIVNIWELMTALTKILMGSLVPMWSAWTKPLATSIDERHGQARMRADSMSLTLWLEKSEKRFTAFRDAYWVQTYCTPKARVSWSTAWTRTRSAETMNMCGNCSPSLPSMWLSLPDANHYAQPRTSWS